jgi:hypothetical protein
MHYCVRRAHGGPGAAVATVVGLKRRRRTWSCTGPTGVVLRPRRREPPVPLGYIPSIAARSYDSLMVQGRFAYAPHVRFVRERRLARPTGCSSPTYHCRPPAGLYRTALASGLCRARVRCAGCRLGPAGGRRRLHPRRRIDDREPDRRRRALHLGVSGCSAQRASNLYPTPQTVLRKRGWLGSGSSFSRKWRMCTVTVLASPAKS